ncbi:MAG TPA: 16S rRNA (cytosine(967)-C(5))-methyltransferase RsmB [Nevskiaceae bacterium]|nr:16S rRNA (cytosine(967)-C(5))-methyltransferase RsmB [Nevskiaceae bacterium]
MSGAALRAEAARCVLRVQQGRSLDDSLGRAQVAERDGALLQAIAYGVLRDRSRLDALIDALLRAPIEQPCLLRALLQVGLYQLRSLRIPAHAAVSETVAATEALDLARYRALVNALLRRYQREQDALEAALPQGPAVQLSYPDWLITAIRADWPRRWREVLEAGNLPGPMTLRVNRLRQSREAYQARLQAAGLGADTVPGAAEALRLHQPVAVSALPGFAEGEVSVQDASAQLAASLFDLRPGLRVLDACAAPGGKTAHLLEREPALDLLALDRDGGRLAQVEDTLQRLGLSARCQVADAAEPAGWWDGRPFDRILIDAPCSGSGVIRRHPDIKWLRRRSDLSRLAGEQARLLSTLWERLAPGGELVYATCSIFAAEGEAIGRAFLAATPDAKAVKLEVSWGEPLSVGRRLAPGGDWDGFYYLKLRRSAGRNGG